MTYTSRCIQATGVVRAVMEITLQLESDLIKFLLLISS